MHFAYSMTSLGLKESTMMEHKIKSVYAEQFGAWWKLTVAQWRELCKSGIANNGHELPESAMLKNRPSFIHAVRNESGRASYWTTRNDILVCSPLDWESEAYQQSLDELDEMLNLPQEAQSTGGRIGTAPQ